MITEFKGDYRFLSNFYPVKVPYRNIDFKSVEHAYQAAKSLDPKDWKYVASLVKASDAKQFGKKVKLRPDWERIKDSVMADLLCEKFIVNKEMRDKLLATGDVELVEGNTWGDVYWGVCDGKGKNVLGRMLIALREFIRKNKDKIPDYGNV